MKRWLVLGVGLAMTACVNIHPGPGVSEHDWLRAEVECKALAEQGAGPHGLLGRSVIVNDLLSKCLRSRGGVVQ
jgi:hypothetical protein